MVGQDAFIAVYMMSNKPLGTLYVGVTSRLLTRVWEHRDGAIQGFTQKYDLKRLVWYEAHERMDSAIAREKEIKRYRRDWKLNLIAASNPHWNDLYPALMKAEGYKMPPPM